MRSRLLSLVIVVFQALLYKCLLEVLGERVRQKAMSGAVEIRSTRGVSKGSHKYSTDER